MRYPFQDSKVAAVFAGYADDLRPGILTLRDLILDTAAEMPEVGRIEETLKWGQPSYLTPDTKSGTTIRVAPTKQGGFAIFSHCQTTVMSDMRAIFPDDFTYDGNRAIQFEPGADIPQAPLVHLIRCALTYHKN